MALRVEQQITWFQIPMNQLARMYKFECFDKLIDNKLLMYLLQDTRSNDNMQIYK